MCSQHVHGGQTFQNLCVRRYDAKSAYGCGAVNASSKSAAGQLSVCTMKAGGLDILDGSRFLSSCDRCEGVAKCREVT